MSIKDDLMNFGKTVIKKGGELANIAKFKLEISSLNEKIKIKKINIADIVIKNGINTKNDDINSFIEEIDDLKSRIKAIETKIKNIEING